jgi:hypothetical protein
MKEEEYLLLLSQKGKSFKPLKEKFKEMEACYTGIGYAFPQKYQRELKALVDKLPDIRLVKQPLPSGHTFESLRLSYKGDWLIEQRYEMERELSELSQRFSLELTEEAINSSDLPDSYKEHAREKLEKKASLEEQIEWTKAIEEASKIFLAPSFKIQFLKEKGRDFLLKTPPPMPRLVNFCDENGQLQPLIRKGITAMVAGAGGAGKTHWLLQLGLSIATGVPFLGKFPIDTPGHVFIGLGENADDDIQRLLKKIFDKMFPPPPNLTIENEESKKKKKDWDGKVNNTLEQIAVHSFTGMDSSFIYHDKSQRLHKPTPLFESFLRQLKEYEPEEGWACIILDPISRFLGAEAETDNAAATAFISLLERITIELKGKPTVIFGHHMNKSGVSGGKTEQDAARGSSALTDGVRLQINLDKVWKDKEKTIVDREKIKMAMVKSNFTSFIPDQVLEKDCGVLQSQTLPKIIQSKRS